MSATTDDLRSRRMVMLVFAFLSAASAATTIVVPTILHI
jgi:hypothetical protein